MAEVVNLRQFRKKRKREERAQLAQENRTLFGEPTAMRKLRETIDDREERLHDAHRLGKPDDAD